MTFHAPLLPRGAFPLHLPEVDRKTRNENSQQILEKLYWIWPGSNAITHFNDSQKMNIATAKVLKLKLYVSIPGWPEKNCPKKPRREKRTGNLGRARHILRPPPGLNNNNNNKFIQYYHFVQVLPIKITIINS